jgi:L-ascorbate metabolism protein UlaG (beta-lactamase superfamily)
MKIRGIELKWLGHSGFLIENSKVIYIDPYQIKDGLPKADLVLLTHDHYDHCSVNDLNKILDKKTILLMTAGCQSKVVRFDIPLQMEIVEPNQEFEFGKIKISTVPAYNLDKSFHPQKDNLVGYLIKINDVIIYHAGDSDLIPEMQKLTGYNKPSKSFIALLPVGGRFTMNCEEAFEAAKLIKPEIVIPIHWGSVIGPDNNANEFKELCDKEGIRCEILVKE